MSGGGGGPLDIALDMLEPYKNSSVKLYSPDSVEKTEYAVVIAGMGDPTQAFRHDFNKILTYTYNRICTISKHLENKSIFCVYSGELGGFNTFVPIFLALNNSDIKLIDADASGRAVPGLNTALASINGEKIAPFVVSNENDDCVVILPADTCDANKCEEISRGIAGEKSFASVAGIAGWILHPYEMDKKIIPGAVSDAGSIGSFIREYRDIKKSGSKVFGSIFRFLTEKKNIRMIELIASTGCYSKVRIQEVITKESDAFNIGKIKIIQYNTGTIKWQEPINWLVDFINENMVIYKEGVPIMTAPDIICIFDEDNGMPLTNSYIVEHCDTIGDRNISIGLIPVSEKWWLDRTADDMTAIWKEFFVHAEYQGECIPFQNIHKM